MKRTKNYLTILFSLFYFYLGFFLFNLLWTDYRLTVIPNYYVINQILMLF